MNNIINSLAQTLPLNIEMNKAFGKTRLPLDATDGQKLERLLPQTKLILDEFHETINEEDISMVVDGIGDIITTTDGFIGFLNISKELEECMFTEISESPMQWTLSGVELSREECLELYSVDEIMMMDYIMFQAAYNALKPTLELWNDPKLQSFFTDGRFDDALDSMGYDNDTNEGIDNLVQFVYSVRYKVDSFSRYLGYDPVKILKEVQASNMSKLCDSHEKAVQTIQKYAEEGLTQLEIKPSALEGLWMVLVTEETMFRGQLIPKGKFMKGVDYWSPDFSKANLVKFQLDC